MDISVSRLNGRLASKLPPELPLGLVFVVGKVGQVGGNRFVLKEETHCLTCRSIEAVAFREGDDVRASGHLMFDAERLQYYLLARDVEVVRVEPLTAAGENSRELLVENEALLSALAAVKARAEVAPTEKPAEVPVWVQKLAPPEVQPLVSDDQDDPAEKVGIHAPAAQQVKLDDGLVSLLSAAMDSEEVLELTPELLAPYQVAVPETAVPLEKGVKKETSANSLMDTAVPTTPTSYQPTNREETDWLVILLIISFFVLTIAAIVTIVLLIL